MVWLEFADRRECRGAGGWSDTEALSLSADTGKERKGNDTWDYFACLVDELYDETGASVPLACPCAPLESPSGSLPQSVTRWLRWPTHPCHHDVQAAPPGSTSVKEANACEHTFPHWFACGWHSSMDASRSQFACDTWESALPLTRGRDDPKNTSI